MGKTRTQERRKRPATQQEATLGNWEDASIGKVFAAQSWDLNLTLQKHLKAYLVLHAYNPSPTLGRQEDVWACLPANVVSPRSQHKSPSPNTRWTVPEELTLKDDFVLHVHTCTHIPPKCTYAHTKKPELFLSVGTERRTPGQVTRQSWHWQEEAPAQKGWRGGRQGTQKCKQALLHPAHKHSSLSQVGTGKHGKCSPQGSTHFTRSFKFKFLPVVCLPRAWVCGTGFPHTAIFTSSPTRRCSYLTPLYK